MVERGSDAKMIRTLTSTDVTSLETLKQGWKVRDILQWVASHTTPCFNAFIDTGALITGLTNEEVARALLSIGGAGMKNIEVVVFFDDDGKQLFVDRGGGMPAPLSRCGVGKNRRFVFYDQVHTTGTDVKHKLDAVAAVRARVKEAGGVVDYVEVREQKSLIPARAVPANAKAVCLIAALFGDVRLLDNLELGGEDA